MTARLWTILAALLGLAAGTGLIAWYGFGEVATALATAGWRSLFAIAAFHAVLIALCGFAWWQLLPTGRPSPLVLIWGRFVRDAASEVLPLSQLGGYLTGIRAVMVQGLTRDEAVASTVVDVTLELVAQIVFTALGLALLLHLKQGTALDGLALPVGIGIVVAAIVVIGFVMAQRRGAAVFERLTRRLAVEWLGRAVAASRQIQEAIHGIYRRRSGLWACGALHLFCWTASAGEVWLALIFLREPLDFVGVLAIESLVYAIRSVAFMVPNAVGVQEGAYVMLGMAFGLNPQTALALSLLKRGRDLMLGIPALALWQTLEAKRVLRKRDPDPESAGSA